MAKRNGPKKEYGDFQTPAELAKRSLNRLKRDFDLSPRSIIEPTCGKGGFLIAAVENYPDAAKFIGLDINKTYLDELENSLSKNKQLKNSLELIHADFFTYKWKKTVNNLPEPIFIIGNPPWVTNSDLGIMNSGNIPEKNNFQEFSGIDAITGKANFDISEWMILQYLKWIEGKEGVVAALCKTAVARKILSHIWKNKIPVKRSAIYKIDASYHFRASVEACLFITQAGRPNSFRCDIYDSLEDKKAKSNIGFIDDLLVSDINTYVKYAALNEKEDFYQWRSGVKHDCGKIMELNYDASGKLVNGFNEVADVESECVYPLLKSSDISGGTVFYSRKKILITQKNPSDDTERLILDAPKTWRYLQTHKNFFHNRKSVIYKRRGPFSIFGIGDYSFAPYKISISGLYKNLNFALVEPLDNKPVMFDDTIYFLSCSTYEEALFIYNLISSKAAEEYLKSLIFWDNKRPITIDILKRLSLAKLAKILNKSSEYDNFAAERHNKFKQRTLY